MKCCKCNTEITGRSDRCPGCGMRLKEYRHMVYLSNGLYNAALERAGKKDLSGAVTALKRCLELNKRQIQARNLYGLILYELGEAGEAAVQWKLSMALDPEDKQAARLYKKTVGSRGELSRLKDAAGKYNQALRCTREGALDLAAVHLKKVLSVYPHYAKAAKLMALICIKQEDYARACRVLNPLLQFNATDKQALRYMEENYMNKLKLADVAEQCFVSQWHLSKLLNRYKEQSFSDILNNIRIEKAKEMLKDPTLRIGDVAEEVGFMDMAHFSRVFKKQVGFSANEYRNTVIPMEK